MKKTLGVLLGLALASMARGQAIADYAQLISNFAVRLDSGSGIVSSGSITGGTCTNQVVTALDTAGVPTCSSLANAMVPATTFTLGKLSFTATQRLGGRNTAGAGGGEEVTTTQALDWIGSTQGQILYRDSASWTALAAGTSKYMLSAQGAAANPRWVGPGSDVTVSNNPAGAATLGFDPRTQWFLYDEFLGVPATTTNPGGALAWTVSNQNTPGNLTKLTPVTATTGTDHPGVVVFTGNVGNNASQLIRTDQSAFTIRGGEVGECMIYILAAATGNGDYGCGFGDSTSSLNAPTDGAVLYYNSVTSANWLVKNRSAAGGSSSASNLAVTTGAWHRLTVYIESVGGAGAGIVHYYVDGTELNVSPVLTNVPQGDNATGYNVGFVQATGGGAVALMYLDYVLLYGPLSR